MSVEKKLNFTGNMHNFVSQKLADAFEMTGKVLPAVVVSRAENMVTISFQLRDIPYTLPQVTIPIFGPQYIRYPMQPGDKGIVIPADTYLGGVSGLGGGDADLTPPGKSQRPGVPACQPYGVGKRRWRSINAVRA